MLRFFALLVGLLIAGNANAQAAFINQQCNAVLPDNNTNAIKPSAMRACVGYITSGVGNPSFTYNGMLSTSLTAIVSGTVSATHFVGDGSGLTGISATASSIPWSGITGKPTGITNISNSTGSVTATTFSGTLGNFTNIAGTITQGAQGNITSVGSLQGLSVVGDITATNAITAIKFYGDGSSLTGISSTGSVTPTWSNITGIPTVLQNISNSTGSVTVTSINAATHTGGNFIGNGSGLTNVSASSVAYGNVTGVPIGVQNVANGSGSITATSVNAATGTFTNIGGTITQAAQGNITSLGTLTGLTSSGIISANTLDSFILSSTSINGTTANLSGGLTTGAVVASGNISAATFTGNGSALTGVSASSVAYGNVTGVPVGVQNIANGTGSVTVTSIAATNIAGTLTQAAQGNITSVGTLTGLTVNGIITATNYISASTYFGDGSHLTGISGGSSTLPASPANSVQFNNAGAFGGSSNFTWNGSLVSATAFKGDGSQLTGIAGSASPSWYAVTNIPTVIQNISNSTGSVTVTSINAVNGVFSGTITPTVYGVNINTTASNTQVMYVSGTSMDGALGLVYFNNPNWVTIGTQTGNAPVTPNDALQITGGIAMTGAITGTTLVSTSAGGTVNTTNLTVANATCTGTCTGFGAAGSGTPISTTTFTAATNISNNTVIGFNSGSGVGAIDNTVYGAKAGGSFTAGGNNNTIIGQNVGVSITSGQLNTIIGQNSFKTETTGLANTVVGSQAMQNTVGSGNNAIFGNGAGSSMNGGNNNTFLGTSAAVNLTSGTSNIAIGQLAQPFSNTGSNQLSIGNIIYGDLGRALAGRIGINVTSPTASLEVSGTVSTTALFVNGVQITTNGGGGGGSSISTTQNAAGNVSGSIGVGFNALVGTGVRNSSFGANAMVSNTTGTDNTAFGYNSLPKNATSGSNSSFGSQAMLSYNDSSGNNAAFGVTALSGLTTGSSNTGMGSNALGNVGTGSLNTSLGSGAGGTLVSGSSNLMLGASAAPFNTTGSNQLSIQNIIYGDLGRALNGRIGVNVTSPTASFEVSGTISTTNIITSGTLVAQNVTVLGTCTNCGTGGGGGTSISTTTFTAASNISASTDIGFNASVGTGVSNSTFGANAGKAITTGSGNIFMGSDAGLTVTTGQSNTIIGSEADPVFTNLSNMTILGANAGGNYNNNGGDSTLMGYAASQFAAGASSVVIGSQARANLTNASVSSNHTGDVVVGAFAYGGNLANTHANNVMIGFKSGLVGAALDSNTLIGAFAGQSLTTGSNNIIIGAGSDVLAATSRNALNIGNVIYGDTGRALNSFVGINVVSPTVALQISGSESVTNISVTSNITYGGTLNGVSDRRAKQNIQPLPPTLAKIMQVQPVSYEFKAQPGDTRFGFIAQDLVKPFPQVAHGTDATGWTVEYTGMIAPLLRAVQEQQQEIDELRAKLDMQPYVKPKTLWERVEWTLHGQ